MIIFVLTEQQTGALAGLLDAAVRQVGLRAVDDVKAIKDIMEAAIVEFKNPKIVKASLGRAEINGEIKNVDAPV